MEKNLNSASLEDILKAIEEDMKGIQTAINHMLETDKYYQALWETYVEADNEYNANALYNQD